MRTLYLDCFAGISGDMFLGALVDLGLSLETLNHELASLEYLSFDLSAHKTLKNNIAGTKIEVKELKHQHVHRHLSDINLIIESSTLAESVKSTAKEVFLNLAQAEAHVHNSSVENVHFHEVGAIDSIVDVLGVVCALSLLKVERIVCSPLPLGKGTIHCAHGLIPLPAPATCELLKGIPVVQAGFDGETVTPTGAALVRTLCSEFGQMPKMEIAEVGYGAGTADRKVPNLLRAFLGVTEMESPQKPESIKLIETNIDDMNPEFFGHVVPLLLGAGALDVFITPIIMKKGRPAHLLTCLTEQAKLQELVDLILKNTTSLGVRISDCNRIILNRELVPIQTKYGLITIKVARSPQNNEIFNISPEWEDCKKAAISTGIPVKFIYDTAKAIALADYFSS